LLVMLTTSFVVFIEVASEGMLVVRRLRKRHAYSLKAAKFRRILSPDGSIDGLEIREGETTEFVPSHKPTPPEQKALSEFCMWLSGQGIDLSDHRRLIERSPGRALGLLILEGTFWILTIFLTLGLVLVAAFWFHWLRFGSLDFIFHFPVVFGAGFLAGMLLVVWPVRGWMWKLVQGNWRRAKSGDAGLRVLVTDAAAPSSLWRAFSQGAVLRLKGGQLEMDVGARRICIARDQVREIKKLSLRDSILDLNTFLGRYQCTPTELAWDDADGNRYAVRLVSTGGGTFRKDRHIDRDLELRLVRWWLEGEEWDLGVLPGSRMLRAPVLAVVFLALGFGIPILHNTFLMRYVRTGRWSPPSWIEPHCQFRPSVPGVEAVPSGNIALREYCEGGPKGEMVVLFREWTGNPVDSRPRPLGVPWTNGVSSFPGPATHAVTSNGLLMGAARVPPTLRPSPGEFPPQLISFETGRARDLPSLPDKPTWSRAALYGDKRFFYVKEVDTQTSTVTRLVPEGLDWEGTQMRPGMMEPAFFPGMNISPTEDTMTSTNLVPVSRTIRIPILEPVWVDLATGESHALPRFPDTEEDRWALFFPDGRHVLFGWTVIDLESGSQRPVLFPSGGKPPDRLFPGPFFSFGGNDGIRTLQPGYSTEESDFEEGDDFAEPTARKTGLPWRVWEVDPETARCEVIDEFPPDTRVAAADGDLWLLARSPEQKGGDIRIQLYDHASRRRSGSSTVPAKSWLMLESGTHRVLIAEPDGRWQARHMDWD